MSRVPSFSDLGICKSEKKDHDAEAGGGDADTGSELLTPRQQNHFFFDFTWSVLGRLGTLRSTLSSQKTPEMNRSR